MILSLAVLTNLLDYYENDSFYPRKHSTLNQSWFIGVIKYINIQLNNLFWSEKWNSSSTHF